MTAKYYVDINGGYIGGFDGAEPPIGSIEVPIAPENALDIWDGTQWVSTPQIRKRHITKLAFRNRFLMIEKTAIELAKLDDPAAPIEQRQQAASVRVYLSDLNAATYVDLDRPDTRAGVALMESSGLIGSGRAEQILDTEISPEEQYRSI